MSKPLKTDCLDSIIGLSRTDCECFEVPTVDSESGLFLDEVEGLNLKMIDAGTDCETGSLWDLLRYAREQAILAYKADFAGKLAMSWKMARIPFKGQIGRDKFSTDYNVGAVSGHRYVFGNVKNGLWKVTRIATLFNTSGSFDVKIYNNVEDDALYTINVTSVANKVTWTTLETPLNLPMYDAQAEYLQYFFLYEYPGFKPKDNSFKCCSTVLNFNCYKPVLMNINDARYMFHRWCNVTGVNGASVDAIRDSSSSFNNHAMGLLVDGEMKCDTQGIACNDTDYNYSAIAKVKAYAIWYRAGAFLANAILSSQNINRFTMLDREALYGKRNNYLKEYSNRLEWLTNPQVDEVKTALLQSGCVECIQRMAFKSML